MSHQAYHIESLRVNPVKIERVNALTELSHRGLMIPPTEYDTLSSHFVKARFFLVYKHDDADERVTGQRRSLVWLLSHLEDTTSYSPEGWRSKKSRSSMRGCCDLRSIARTSNHGTSSRRVLIAPTCKEIPDRRHQLQTKRHPINMVLLRYYCKYGKRTGTQDGRHLPPSANFMVSI